MPPMRSGGSLVAVIPATGAQWVLDVELGGGAPAGEAETFLGLASRLAGLALRADGGRLRASHLELDGAAPLIGSSAVMARLRRRLERVATTDFTVLVEGESGTGKELVARQIHELSRRRQGPFVAVNCAALVETLLEAELFGIEERTATGVRGRRGKFEHAAGGTLFLDEISDLSMSAQAKLLRAIQDLSVERVGATGTRRVDVRIVAATNRALADVVEQGVFRPDLFYRLSGVEIAVPPLCARRDDVRELAGYFLSRHVDARPIAFSDAALDALQLYRWPGNVRELERLVESTVAMVEGARIELDDLPAKVRGEYAEVLAPALDRRESLRAWGSRYARLVYERCGRNKRRTCRWLDISYHTLVAYLRYGQETAHAPHGQMPGWVRTAGPSQELSARLGRPRLDRPQGP
jgi:transcriptional regulator with PAS, ATPase and Fis domain